MKTTIKISNRKRANKHGFKKRMSSTAGKKVLSRRRKKGRKNLTVSSEQLKNSLGSNAISQLLKTSKPIYTENFKIRAAQSNHLKVGFAIKRSCGSAVLRNRFKRQIRAFTKELSLQYSPIKILIITEKNIKKISFCAKGEIENVFKTICKA